MTELDIPAAREIALRVLDPDRMPELGEAEAVLRLFLEITDPSPVTGEFFESNGMTCKPGVGPIFETKAGTAVRDSRSGEGPLGPWLYVPNFDVGLVRHALAIEPK